MNRVGVYAYLLCAEIVNICIHINVECLGFDVRKMNCIDVLFLMRWLVQLFCMTGFYLIRFFFLMNLSVSYGA